MSKWIYVGGTTSTEHASQAGGDERSGVEMPDSTTAFGIKFIVGQPVDVSRDKFPTEGAHRHALRKLETNKFFKPFAEEVLPPVTAPAYEPDFEGEVAEGRPAKRGPGRPPKVDATA